MKITPRSNNGTITIRFTYNGTKYSLASLGKYTSPQALCTANYIANNIQSDVHMGRFTSKDSQELFYQYHPMGEEAKERDTQRNLRSAQQILCSLDSLSNPLSAGLRQIRILLSRYGKGVLTHDDAASFVAWLNDGSRKPQSINRYLNELKPVCPMFKDIERLKPTQAEEQEPFSLEEIGKIIESFDKHYPHYSDFVKFIFSTGCRPNEATAFTYSSFNKAKRTITIRAAIAKDSNGKKIEKDTKTGASRTFPITDNLFSLLLLRSESTWSKRKSEYVFTSPNGHIIDTNFFGKNYWSPALDKAGVEYRTLYNCRHTFISHYIEKYKDYQKCAAITHGTSSGVQTIIKHYSHLVSAISILDLF